MLTKYYLRIRKVFLIILFIAIALIFSFILTALVSVFISALIIDEKLNPKYLNCWYTSKYFPVGIIWAHFFFFISGLITIIKVNLKKYKNILKIFCASLIVSLYFYINFLLNIHIGQ
jgi:hypothetical protein